jgi:Flp pilus assembly protein CpaB
MRSGRILIVVAVILIFGLVVAVVALPRILPGLGATPTPAPFEVYYAIQEIAQGATITDEYLGFYTLPQTAVAEGMFTRQERDQLVGKFAKYPISAGVIITSQMVSDSTDIDTGGPQIAALIPVGMNAIAVPITRLGSVGFAVTDGARVNVTACMLMVDVDPSYQTELPSHIGVLQGPANVKPEEMPGISLGLTTYGDPSYQGRTEVEPAFQQGVYIIPSEPQRPRLVCQMILQDVRVLKLGDSSVKAAATDGQPAQSGQAAESAPPPPDIITLVVTPQDAVTLTYMIYANIPLNLTLRRGGDDSRQDTEAATLQFLLSQYDIPVPVKLAYGLTPRIDILTLPFLPNDVITVPAQ